MSGVSKYHFFEMPFYLCVLHIYHVTRVATLSVRILARSTSPSSAPSAPMLPPPSVQEQSSVSLIPSAPNSPDWSPSALPSSHSAGTRLRQIRPPTTLHIGRESDLQATQGQSFTSDENPISRPPRAKTSHRTRIRSSGHPGPKLHIGSHRSYEK